MLPFLTPGRLAAAIAGAGLLFTLAPPAAAQSPATGSLITGTVEFLEIDNPNDVWSSGRMVVGGQQVILPRNLLIDLPANRLTLQQLFADAPPAALAEGKSGLAVLDGGVGIPGNAVVLGNRTSFGNVIAGEVFIAKGIEAVTGVVTFIDHTDGYLRIDGIPGDDTTGLMIRINDPEGRHTIQQGVGCDGGPNCSPDVRFGLDPDNYTISFATGYPAGIPSTVPTNQRSGFRAGDPIGASNASGVGDPFAPSTNRGTVPVLNSTRLAPIQVGDTISAEGNFEFIADVRFLSVHTLTVFDDLITANSPTQPDYFVWEEVEWDIPAFNNERVRGLFIGFSTLPDSPIDLFSLHVDPDTNENNEFWLGTTIGNPDTINQGIGATAGGIFKIRYDVDFLAGVDPRRSPCQNLLNAGINVCPSGGTLLENFRVLSPVSREMIGRSRHKAELNPGVISRDINGNEMPNGEYLTPVGLGHPEFGEIDLGALQSPFAFDGITWNLDRRLGPGGCDGNCENDPQPLDPFPWSGRDPLALVAFAGDRPHAHFPFGPGDFVDWPPAAPAAFPIMPTPQPGGLGDPGAPPQADFSVDSSGGDFPLTVNFTDLTQGSVNARLWDFGDGAFSIAQNPSHTFMSAGVFDVSLTAMNLAGVDVETKLDLVTVTAPGGPDAPTPDFTQDRTAGNAPLTVNFTDLSTGDVSSWLWSFGDGGTSTAQNPSHVYASAGSYDVALTASGPGGSNALTKLDAVLVNELGGVDIDFQANPRTGPAPLNVRFRTQVLAGQGTGITGTWHFGDGTTAPANGQPIFHLYTNPGLYTVTLIGTNGVDTDIEQKVNFINVTAPLLPDPHSILKK